MPPRLIPLVIAKKWIRVADKLDVLLLHDLLENFTYRAIHDFVKPYGDVVRIRLIYDVDCPSNRCYVFFATATEARSTFQAAGSFNIPGLHAETLSSRNVTESHLESVPNILEHASLDKPLLPGGSLPIITMAGGISYMPPGTCTQKLAAFPGKTLKNMIRGY